MTAKIDVSSELGGDDRGQRWGVYVGLITLYIQKIRFFNQKVQEREERCSWKPDNTVIITLNFSYREAAKSLKEVMPIEERWIVVYLDSKSAGSVYAFAAIGIGFNEMFWIAGGVH